MAAHQRERGVVVRAKICPDLDQSADTSGERQRRVITHWKGRLAAAAPGYRIDGMGWDDVYPERPRREGISRGR